MALPASAYSKLVSAAMLQDLLVDKITGLPLAAGVVKLYQDNSRLTYKNWYYQTGSPGAYTYTALDNPLTLSSAGCIVDPSGNDCIPFFYPYSETDNVTVQTYYITVENSAGVQQFTRQNFPYVPNLTTANPTFDNLVINNRFWRNIGSLNAATLTNTVSINSVNYYYSTLAPSQHDGFSMPDFIYMKNVNGATETITFQQFPLVTSPLDDPVLTGDIQPEFYIDHNCTVLQAGETVKTYQFPISLHIRTLEAQTGSISIQARNISGNTSLTVGIFKYLGTGSSSALPITPIDTITLEAGASSFSKHIVPFTFPSVAADTLSNAGDDAYYLQIGMPNSAVFRTYFTLPSVFLSETVPSNSFETYDQIDAVINSPRTGDIRQSINSYYPYGWVAMNNGSIGNASSNGTARANADTWPLFNLLWTSFNLFSQSTANTLAQMYSSAGAAVAYGATAIADFNANRSLQLTQTMGKVLLGSVPFSALLQPDYYDTATFTANTVVLSTSHSQRVFNGMPFYVKSAITSNIATYYIAYVTNFNGTTTFSVSTTFALAMAGTPDFVFTNGTGTVVFAPASSFEGEYAHTQLAAEIAAHTHTAVSTWAYATGGFAGGGSTCVTPPPGGGNTWPVTTTIANNTPSGSSMNVTQPGYFMNIYIKL